MTKLLKLATSRQRGFAIITALGVMVLLGIMAFGAVTTTHFTFGFARARQHDRNMGSVLHDTSQLLQHHSASFQAGTPVSLLKNRTLGNRDLEVSATLLAPAIAAPLLGAALAPREGDQVIEVAAEVSGFPGRRTATYLVNSQGARTAPILLLERRL